MRQTTKVVSKRRILFYVLIGYGITMTVILLSKGCEKAPSADLAHLKHEADSLRTVNHVIEQENVRLVEEIHAVSQRLDMIDLHLSEIQEEKIRIKDHFEDRKNGLGTISQDSLKQVALEH